MVELRKRPAPPLAPPPAKKKASSSKSKKATTTAAMSETTPAAAPAPAPAPAAKSGAPKVGDNITLEGFGGEVETNDGEKVTLAKLVEKSKSGVVIFTYPKASTPGCKLNFRLESSS